MSLEFICVLYQILKTCTEANIDKLNIRFGPGGTVATE